MLWLTCIIMEPWNLKETYNLIESLHGAASESFARESLRSVLDRQAFVRFHYQELVRLTKLFEKNYIKRNLFVDLHASPGGRTREAFERFIIKVGAHATAAVQGIHALPDLLAHAIYFSTGHDFQDDPKKEKTANLRWVAEKLKKTSEYEHLSLMLFETQEGVAWEHLAALSNSSKHRSLIRTSLNEDWTGNKPRKRELQFTHFKKEQKQYPSIAVLDLIEPEFDRLSRIIVRIGHVLNTALRSIKTVPERPGSGCNERGK